MLGARATREASSVVVSESSVEQSVDAQTHAAIPGNELADKLASQAIHCDPHEGPIGTNQAKQLMRGIALVANSKDPRVQRQAAPGGAACRWTRGSLLFATRAMLRVDGKRNRKRMGQLDCDFPPERMLPAAIDVDRPLRGRRRTRQEYEVAEDELAPLGGVS